MPTYIYEILDESGEGTGQTIETIQSIKDDAFTEMVDETSSKTFKVRRFVTGGCGTLFRGGGWTVSSGSRGYQGKYTGKLRPVGTPVDAPAHKKEADRQFQAFIDNGGMTGIKPTISSGQKTQTTEQMLDKKYNPHK